MYSVLYSGLNILLKNLKQHKKCNWKWCTHDASSYIQNVCMYTYTCTCTCSQLIPNRSIPINNLVCTCTLYVQCMYV